MRLDNRTRGANKNEIPRIPYQYQYQESFTKKYQEKPRIPRKAYFRCFKLILREFG